MKKFGGEDVFSFKFPVKDQEGKPNGHYSIRIQGYDPQKPDWVDFQHAPANSQVRKTPQFNGQYSLCLFQTNSLQGDNNNPVSALGIRVLPAKEAVQGTIYGFDIQGGVRREAITIPPKVQTIG